MEGQLEFLVSNQLPARGDQCLLMAHKRSTAMSDFAPLLGEKQT
jgi:hypothetical protein